MKTITHLIVLQVYKLSIGAVCGLSWPSDRLIVQVLDDSTNEVLRVSLSTQHYLRAKFKNLLNPK